MDSFITRHHGYRAGVIARIQETGYLSHFPENFFFLKTINTLINQTAMTNLLLFVMVQQKKRL